MTDEKSDHEPMRAVKPSTKAEDNTAASNESPYKGSSLVDQIFPQPPVRFHAEHEDDDT